MSNSFTNDRLNGRIHNNNRSSSLKRRASPIKRYRSRSNSPRHRYNYGNFRPAPFNNNSNHHNHHQPHHLNTNNMTTNYHPRRYSSPTYHSRTRYRSRSPINHHQYHNISSHAHSYHPSYNSYYNQHMPHNYPINHRQSLKSREEEMVRYNPPENDILAIFGLSKRVNEQDLYDLYKKFGCKECKVIIDKHVNNVII
jgi:hypothetical protein